MEARELAASTIDRRLSTVCGFYRFAHIDGRIGSNPAEYVRHPQVHPSDARGLDRSEFGMFLAAADHYDFAHQALAVLLGSTGAPHRWVASIGKRACLGHVHPHMLRSAFVMADFSSHGCRQIGHALHEPVHANDLWVAAWAVHIGAPLLTADTGLRRCPRAQPLPIVATLTERSGAIFGTLSEPAAVRHISGVAR